MSELGCWIPWITCHSYRWALPISNLRGTVISFRLPPHRWTEPAQLSPTPSCPLLCSHRLPYRPPSAGGAPAIWVTTILHPPKPGDTVQSTDTSTSLKIQGAACMEEGLKYECDNSTIVQSHEWSVYRQHDWVQTALRPREPLEWVLIFSYQR